MHNISRSTICRIGSSFSPSIFDIILRHNRSAPFLYVVLMSSSSNNVRHGIALPCWHCGEATHAQADHGISLLCSRCGRLQPLHPNIDFFSYFGLNEPAGASVDESELKRRFRRMQSLVHPDKFAGRAEHERNLSEQHSTFLNNAYRTLREPFARAEYLLNLLDTVRSDSTASSSSSSENRTLADDEGTVENSAMAAEMMELMESIEQMEQGSAQIGQRLVDLDLEMYRLLRQANDQIVARDFSNARQTLRRISYLRRSRRLLEAKRNGEHNE